MSVETDQNSVEYRVGFGDRLRPQRYGALVRVNTSTTKVNESRIHTLINLAQGGVSSSALFAVAGWGRRELLEWPLETRYVGISVDVAGRM